MEIEAAELASWLAEQAADVLWSVDGEEALAGEVSLPCTGEDLAAVLRRHGGRIRVALPANVASPEGELTRQNVEVAAEHDAGARIFRLAWAKDDAESEPWLIVEDTLARAASGMSAA